MPLLNTADAVYLGAQPADRVYLGAEQVWAPPVVGTGDYASEVLADDPLGYWRLGEAPPWSYGMPAPDASGRRAGTYTGTPTLGVPGLLPADSDTAMQVAGANGQGMQLANHADYEIGTLTLEAWVKTTNAGASFRSIAVKQNAYGIFAIDGVLGTYVWGTGTVVNTGATIQDGAPHHVAMVLREGVAGGSQLYRDGVPVGAAFTYVTSSHGQPLDFGYNSFGGQEFLGVLDECALYGTALSAERIAAHYAARSVPPPEPLGPGSSLLVSYTPGSDRNDFTGEVGVRLGIGASNLTVDWVGARCHGSPGTRTVKLYEWFSGVVQRTAVIDYTGAALGEYVWTPIEPITLLAGGYYALLMVVTAYDGQVWANPGPVAYGPSIVNVYDSYFAGSLQTGLQNSSFIGLDLGST